MAGSLPEKRCFPASGLTSGQAFAVLDRLLDEARTGPRHLSDPQIARIVVEALEYGAEVLRYYRLHAFVVMPNHVHMLVTPEAPVAKLMKSLKGITARRANEALRLTGRPFWQGESYDHWVRNGEEFERIRRYIEQNPVRAGLARSQEDYPWSSAGATNRGGPTWRSAAALESRPTGVSGARGRTCGGRG